MLEPKILYETGDFLAIDKPPGMMVHAAKTRHEPGDTRYEARENGETVVDWLLKHRPEVKAVGDDKEIRPGIVHRLDKDTSGLMLVPKTQEYFEYLKSLFQTHEIRKTYFAVVRGVPKKKEGTIDSPIGIQNGTLKRSVRSAKMQKEATTKYKVLASGREYALLQVNPLTGRTHQIRVHLASIGHPIVGDKLYGAKPKGDTPASSRLMLHAAAIEFREKNGSMIKIEAALPEEFGALSTGLSFAQEP